MSSLADAVLYFVSPGGFGSAELAGVIDAGVDVVQLRMKDAEAAEVLAEGKRFKDVCAASRTPFVVNDRPDLALALEAGGVHLGQDDLPPAIARSILGPRAIIGRSTHSTDDIDLALAEHDAGLCDYIAVGPVHETPTKLGRPAVGYDLLRYAAERVPFPWFAIGGIDASNVGDVLDAGAGRIVVVRAIAEAADPVAATKGLVAALS
jgi:thiamine-phosphate pyrophosphorylase